MPVTVDARGDERLPGPVESAAYFVVSEALANVAKYAQATQAAVMVERSNGHVTIEVSDDGVGGADAGRGSGLRGLEDRLAALDGTLSLDSPAGRGTRLRAGSRCLGAAAAQDAFEALCLFGGLVFEAVVGMRSVGNPALRRSASRSRSSSKAEVFVVGAGGAPVGRSCDVRLLDSG